MTIHKLMCNDMAQPGSVSADCRLQELANAKPATHVQRRLRDLSPVSLHAKLQSQPSDWACSKHKLFKHWLFDCPALPISLVTSKARASYIRSLCMLEQAIYTLEDGTCNLLSHRHTCQQPQGCSNTQKNCCKHVQLSSARQTSALPRLKPHMMKLLTTKPKLLSCSDAIQVALGLLLDSLGCIHCCRHSANEGLHPFRGLDAICLQLQSLKL